MKQVPEEIINYIYLNTNELIRPLLLRGFEIVSKFEIPFFSDKYFNIIYSEDDFDPMNTSYVFKEALCKDLEFIIKSHMVTLDTDTPASLETLCIIAESLWALQRLEDYSDIERILTTDHGNQYKFALIVKHLSKIETIKVLETALNVEDDFFDLLNDMIVNYNQTLAEGIEIDEEREITTDFLKYLDDQQTVGGVLLREGWVDKPITFMELMKILPIDLKEIFRKSFLEKEYAYVALDILSVMMLCTDSRRTPIDFFRDHNEMILGSENIEVSRIIHPLNLIYDDYRKSLIDHKVNQE